MNLYDLLFILIDLRSFSNLWYWIGLATIWSSLSRWVMGVPSDLLVSVYRGKKESIDDFNALTFINARRLAKIDEQAGTFLIAASACILTVLFTMAIFYKVEFTQALLFLIGPPMLVVYLTLRIARLINYEKPPTHLVAKRLIRHQRIIKVLGIFSIFTAALFGMFKNLSISILY